MSDLAFDNLIKGVILIVLLVLPVISLRLLVEVGIEIVFELFNLLPGWVKLFIVALIAVFACTTIS